MHWLDGRGAGVEAGSGPIVSGTINTSLITKLALLYITSFIAGTYL